MNQTVSACMHSHSLYFWGVSCPTKPESRFYEALKESEVVTSCAAAPVPSGA